MGDLKLCANCRWLKAPPMRGAMFLDSELICENPKNLQEDPVLGGVKRWTPSWLRSPAGESLCGPDGDWFEAKHG